MTDPKAAASPAPVAWMVNGIAFAEKRFLLDRGYRDTEIFPLYAHPPAAAERIAKLESLLREALHICHLGDGDTDLHERIRAALGEG
jgi:hypothetical protein